MPRFASWLGLSGLVIVLDQLSKLRILALVFNPGAAFSFLSDAGGWQRWFFIALALAVSGWLTLLIRSHAAERLLPLAAALILGGALGNVIDRIRFGAVVDFQDVHAAGWHWPAFNVADSAISLGVALLIWQQLFHATKEKP